MQWWANFLSVVDQLVRLRGPNGPPVYMLKYGMAWGEAEPTEP